MAFTPTKKKPLNQWQGWQPWTGGPVPTGGKAPASGYKPGLGVSTPLFSGPLAETQAGWGSPQDYMGAITGQWDYGQAEAAMRNADIADEAGVNAAVSRGQADQQRFMADLTQALGRTNIGDVSRLAGRGAANSGATAALAGVRQEDYQKQSTTAAQQLADQIAEWRTGLSGRKAERQWRLADVAGQVAARLSADPRYQPREAQYGYYPAGNDPFAPLKNASALQMWNQLQSTPAARKANAGMIARGYPAFLQQYGGQFAGGGVPSGGGYTPPPSSNPFPSGIPVGATDGAGHVWNGRAWVRQ